MEDRAHPAPLSHEAPFEEIRPPHHSPVARRKLRMRDADPEVLLESPHRGQVKGPEARDQVFAEGRASPAPSSRR